MAHPPRGRRVAVVGDGGGSVALAADRLTAYGLLVEPFGARLAADLGHILPLTASTGNPVDVAGGGEEDVFTFERVIRLIAESGEADASLLTGFFGGYSEQSDTFRGLELQVGEAMVQAVEQAGRPLVVQTVYPRSATAIDLRRRGVPVYGDIDAAVRSLGRVVERLANKPFGIPAFIAPKTQTPAIAADDYFGIRRLLAGAGLAFVDARPAESIDTAIAAAEALGYPIALKALAGMHKSDAGGVRLGLADAASLAGAFTEIRDRLHPPLFSVERMAPIDRGVELLIGAKRDRSFGPIALVGIGGLYTEIFRDLAVALAPVTGEQARRLIESLRGTRLLLGERGRPPLDIEAAANALSALSRLASSMPQVSEVEINPLLVLETGALALDARLVTTAG
jgi:acetate---CoA ligase (ADP-forming)